MLICADVNWNHLCIVISTAVQSGFCSSPQSELCKKLHARSQCQFIQMSSVTVFHSCVDDRKKAGITQNASAAVEGAVF